MSGSGLLFLSIPSYAVKLTNRPWKLADFKKIIAIMVLTGGSVYCKPQSNKYSVRYYGKSKILHKIFCALLEYTYNINTEPAKFISRESYFTQIYNKKVVEDLLHLSPTYNTRNGMDTEPSAKFLLDAPYDVAKESIRLGISANGNVQFTIERLPKEDSYYIVPLFAFGYLSPTNLLLDYCKIFDQLGLDINCVMDSRFGKGFLKSRSWNTLETFSRFGGFMDGVQIDRGRYKGINRNGLLRALLGIHKNERNIFQTKQGALDIIENYIMPIQIQSACIN